MLKKLNEVVQYIDKVFQTKKFKPRIAIVLGSGLAPFAEYIKDATTIPFHEIPNMAATTVEGHQGRLVFGMIPSQEQDVPVVLLQGRLHYYEGYNIEDVVFPTRLLCKLGIRCLILTNAAGAVNSSFREGDLMVINDHINLSGVNPLRGKNNSDLGPRFPDLSYAYHPQARSILMSAATKLGFQIREGVYHYFLGPSYETPAEIRMSRILGADAVGMSTVPEVIAANHMGTKVVAISCITNLAAGITSQKLNHEEVMQYGKIGAEKLMTLLSHSLYELSEIK